MHTQRFRVLQYVCEVLLVHVFVFILPFFYSFKCLSDWLFPPKPLSHSQQQVLLRGKRERETCIGRGVGERKKEEEEGEKDT